VSIPGKALSSLCPVPPLGPLWRETPIFKALLYISFRVPPHPPRRAPINRSSFSKAILYLSLKVPGKTNPPPGSPKRPLQRDLPVSRTLFCISLGVPNKKSLLIKSQLSKSPVTEPPFHVPPTVPLWIRSVSRANGLLIHSYESPVKKLYNETGRKRGHLPRSPRQTENLRSMGCCQVSQRDR